MNHYKMLVQEKGGKQIHTFGFAYTDKSQAIKWVEKAAVVTKDKDNKWNYDLSKVAELGEFEFNTYKGLLEKITQVVETGGRNVAGIKVEHEKEEKEAK